MKVPAILDRAWRALRQRSFDAASRSPRWPAWASLPAPARQQLWARHMAASRANYLSANSPSAAAICNAYVTHLIGAGPTVRSAHPDEGVRRALDDSWSRFAARCDNEGLDALTGLLARTVQSLVTAGEAVILLRTTRRGYLRLRLASPEQLDPARNSELEDLGKVIAGVEFNPSGERVAYWLYPEQLDLNFAMWKPAVRLEAADVLHLFTPQFPGQVRGTSWLAPVATRIVELDRLEDALLARASTSALFSAFVRDLEGTSGLTTPQGGEGAAFDPAGMSLEPGVMRILPPGVDITFPQVPDASGQPELLRHMLRSVAAGSAVPYELLAADLSQTNYSSARMGMEAFRRRCGQLQRTLLVARCIEPVWRRMVTLEVLTGRLRLRGFDEDSEPFFAVSTKWPAWPSLDPRKDSQSNVLELQSNLKSRAEIIAERGRSIEDVDREIEADPLHADIAASATSILNQPESANA
jgi:lambda family phage portal protein